MTTYRVNYGYRTDNGMTCATPTHRESVTVEASNDVAARHAAIDAAYQKHSVCSHVAIEGVTELPTVTA